MKEVGDKFGAGELILPFVLQSAEVMKRAVAQLENYLDRIEGHTKGTVVIATVFGDVHDIGKSLVNTILTNNGYTVVDLGKQVPIDTIIDAARRARGRRDRPVGAARLDLQADAAVHPGAARARARVPGADRRRGDQPRLRPPHALPARARSPTRSTSPASSTARTPSPGLDRMDAAGRRGARAARWWRRSATRRSELREKAEEPDDGAAGHRRLGALRRAHRRPDPDAAVLGRARGRRRPRRGLPLPRPPRAVQAALGRARQEGRGVAEIVEGYDDEEGFAPRLERMWREQDYLHPRALLGYFPCNADGNELVIFDPEDPRARARAARLPAPAQARPDLPGRLLPPARQRRARRRRAAGGHGRLRGHRADRPSWSGGRVRRAALRARARRAGRRGPGRVAARARSRRELGIEPDQGRRYSWGYPGLPGPVRAREGRSACSTLEQIGLSLSGGYARRARAVDAWRSSPTTRRRSTSA